MKRKGGEGMRGRRRDRHDRSLSGDRGAKPHELSEKIHRMGRTTLQYPVHGKPQL